MKREILQIALFSFFIVVITVLFAFLPGCTYLDATNATNTTCNYTNYTVVTPECGDLDKVGIFTANDDIETQLSNFIKLSPDRLHCQMEYIESQKLANAIVTVHNWSSNVAILLIRNETFQPCSGEICLPKQESQLNYLIASGIQIRTKDIVTMNYCLNDDSVYVFTQKRNQQNLAIYLESSKTVEVFENEFQSNWQRTVR